MGFGDWLKLGELALSGLEAVGLASVPYCFFR